MRWKTTNSCVNPPLVFHPNMDTGSFSYTQIHLKKKKTCDVVDKCGIPLFNLSPFIPYGLESNQNIWIWVDSSVVSGQTKFKKHILLSKKRKWNLNTHKDTNSREDLKEGWGGVLWFWSLKLDQWLTAWPGTPNRSSWRAHCHWDTPHPAPIQRPDQLSRIQRPRGVSRPPPGLYINPASTGA